MSAKLATLGPLKIKVYWNKGYDVTNKIISSDSNYTVYVVIWSKFDNSSIYEKSYYNLNFIKIWPQKTIFLGMPLV